MSEHIPYAGQELDIFAYANNWKRYWSGCIRPYIHGDVLEVGSGIGSNTALLSPNAVDSWTCLEPDSQLARRAETLLTNLAATQSCRFITGSTSALPANQQYDTLLYIDVLEHIEGDKEELTRASNLLKSGGNLVVLSPAHQSLYTPFDQSIGHFRRYNRGSLSACSPDGCTLTKLSYLDCVGLWASLSNRLFLKQSMPTLKQIVFWDTWMVPASRVLDPLLGYRVGKSILGIWTKLS